MILQILHTFQNWYGVLLRIINPNEDIFRRWLVSNTLFKILTPFLFLTGVIWQVAWRNSVWIQHVFKRLSNTVGFVKCVKQYFTFAMTGIILSLPVLFEIFLDEHPLHHSQIRAKDVLWPKKHTWKTKIWVSSAGTIVRSSSKCTAPLTVTANDIFYIHVLLMSFEHT